MGRLSRNWLLQKICEFVGTLLFRGQDAVEHTFGGGHRPRNQEHNLPAAAALLVIAAVQGLATATTMTSRPGAKTPRFCGVRVQGLRRASRAKTRTGIKGGEIR